MIESIVKMKSGEQRRGFHVPNSDILEQARQLNPSPSDYHGTRRKIVGLLTALQAATTVSA